MEQETKVMAAREWIRKESTSANPFISCQDMEQYAAHVSAGKDAQIALLQSDLERMQQDMMPFAEWLILHKELKWLDSGWWLKGHIVDFPFLYNLFTASQQQNESQSTEKNS